MASLSEIVLAKSFDTDNSLNAFQKTVGTGMQAAALAADVNKKKAETATAKTSLNIAKYTQLKNRMDVILKTANPKIKKVLMQKYDDTATALGAEGISEDNKIALAEDLEYAAAIKTAISLNTKVLEQAGMTPELAESMAQSAAVAFSNVDSKTNFIESNKKMEKLLGVQKEQNALETAKDVRFDKKLQLVNKEVNSRFKKVNTMKDALATAERNLSIIQASFKGKTTMTGEQIRTAFDTAGIALGRAAQPGQLTEKDVKPFLSGSGFLGLMSDLSNLLIAPTVNEEKVQALIDQVKRQAATLDDSIAKKAGQFEAQLDFGEFVDRKDELLSGSGLSKFTGPSLKGLFGTTKETPAKSFSADEIILNATSPDAMVKQLQILDSKIKDTPQLRTILLNRQKELLKSRKPQGQAPEAPVQAPPEEGAQLGTQQFMNQANATLGQ